MMRSQKHTIGRRTFFGHIGGMILGSALFASTGSFITRATNFIRKRRKITVKTNPFAVPRKKQS